MPGVLGLRPVVSDLWLGNCGCSAHWRGSVIKRWMAAAVRRVPGEGIFRVSKKAIAYVHSTGIADETAGRVFLLLAERTKTRSDSSSYDDEIPDVMGLELTATDIPALAARAGVDAQEFRRQLRGLKTHVLMDVLEHPDGVWEIVYGPSYTRPSPPRPAAGDITDSGPHPFWMPGWDQYSTWGYQAAPGGHGHWYAQIIHNSDDPNAEPRIWITPPRYLVRSVDDLAETIAQALAPYERIRPPAVLIKSWLTRPPAR